MKRGANKPKTRRARQPSVPEMRDAHPMTWDLMTIREVADYFHCQPRTIYKLVHDGTLPAFRVGSILRLRRSDLEQYIANATSVLSMTLTALKSKPEPPRRRTKR